MGQFSFEYSGLGISCTLFVYTAGTLTVFPLVIIKAVGSLFVAFYSAFDSSSFLSPKLSSVGNKCEDPSRKQVETADARRFSEQMGVRLFETSAKENLNVEEVLDRGVGEGGDGKNENTQYL